MRKFKVFIAGSKSLQKERELIRVVASKTQSRTGVIIDIKSYDDFNEMFTPYGAQSDYYNKYITSESDLVVFILNGAVGGITKKEFLEAYNSYKMSKTPKICVYSRINDKDNEDIKEIRNTISDLGQYYKDYADNIELERLVETLLMYESLRVSKLKKSLISRLFKYILILMVISGISCYFLLNTNVLDKTQWWNVYEKEYPMGDPYPPQIQQPTDPSKYFDIKKNNIEGLACVSKNGLWGFVNISNEIVVPLIFEDVFAFNEGLAQVKYDGKWGFVDKTGYIAIKPQYESVSKFVEGYAGVEVNGKFGFINRQGELIIPAIYDDIWAFSGGKAKVWMDGESFYINTNGKIIK